MAIVWFKSCLLLIVFLSVVSGDNSTLEPSLVLGPFSSILQLPVEFDESEVLLWEPPMTIITTQAPVLHSTATLDPSLSAVVTKCRDIFYTGLGDPSFDRPGYVRAASSLVWGSNQEQMMVIQDDVNFVGFVKWKDTKPRRSPKPHVLTPDRAFDEADYDLDDEEAYVDDHAYMDELAKKRKKKAQKYKERPFQYYEKRRPSELHKGGKSGKSDHKGSKYGQVQYQPGYGLFASSPLKTNATAEASAAQLPNFHDCQTCFDWCVTLVPFTHKHVAKLCKQVLKQMGKSNKESKSKGKNKGKNHKSKEGARKKKSKKLSQDGCPKACGLLAEAVTLPVDPSGTCEADGSGKSKDKSKGKGKKEKACFVPSASAPVVQPDDDDFALDIDAVWSMALPRIDGRRQFSTMSQNKQSKMDLESAVYLHDDDIMLAFGSGSTLKRDRIVVVVGKSVLKTHAFYDRGGIVNAYALYRKFRENKSFSGSELNIEGAAVLHTSIFGGSFNHVRLTFGLSETDAAELAAGSHGDDRHAVLYLAGAEDSKDSVQDGPVAGSVIGLAVCAFDEGHVVTHCDTRYTPLVNPDGSHFAEKAEGVVLAHDADRQPLGDPRSAARNKRNALIVLDPDADRPGKVCSVSLVGL